MHVYHYCTTHSTGKGQGYNSGILEVNSKIRNNEDYQRLASRLADHLNMDGSKFVIISLTLVS